MKAIVVTNQAAGTAGMTLVERPESQAAINDVVVQVHASGFVSTELAWPSTWADRLDRNRTPSIPGHELAGSLGGEMLPEALGLPLRREELRRAGRLPPAQVLAVAGVGARERPGVRLVHETKQDVGGHPLRLQLVGP